MKAVQKLNKELEIPPSLKEYGLEEKQFLKKIDELAEKAFGDQCTTANPKLPLIPELAEILKRVYYGEDPFKRFRKTGD